jgi:hypothetical protein
MLVVLNQPSCRRLPCAFHQHCIKSNAPSASTSPRSVLRNRGLALWVCGTLLAHSTCQTAVLTTLLTCGSYAALRQTLRERLYDGCDKTAPCHTEVVVAHCFAPFLRWMLQHWRGQRTRWKVATQIYGIT